LDGAYLIWDDLLVTISSQLLRFLPALVKSLLQSLTSRTAIDPTRDVDKEALAMWLLHIFDSNDFLLAWRTDRNATLAVVMKWCCLHPGKWTQYVGREVFEQCDENFQAEWENLFEASLIRTGEDTIEEVLPGAASDNTRDVAKSANVDEGTMGTDGGWSKAVAPMSVPIGVVQ
jgi:ribosomal biogenesis protein LAS1